MSKKKANHTHQLERLLQPGLLTHQLRCPLHGAHAGRMRLRIVIVGRCCDIDAVSIVDGAAAVMVAHLGLARMAAATEGGEGALRCLRLRRVGPPPGVGS